MKEDKKSIIKEALTDYNEIMEAANINAKKKLAEEFPEKFNNLLKEQINKNKKTAKESYKKMDDDKATELTVESEINQEESVMKNQKKETVKVVDETVGSSKPFNNKTKKVVRTEESVGDGKPFGEKAKKPLQTEEFDITELDNKSVHSALDNAEDEDEIMTMEEIEREISEMEGLEEELKGIETSSPSYMEKGNKGVAYDELVKMRNQLDEMIGSMENGEENAENKEGEEYPENHETHEEGHFGREHSEEHDELPSDEDIQEVLGNVYEEEPVEEAHGLSYSSRRQVSGRNLPGKEYLSKSEQDQAPYVQESAKKISGLIKENKSLNKKLNETKKAKETVSALIEQYKVALDKYRTQLKEMSVFNTNLANVNNLLVNEELALTQRDKIKIINEFKNVDSITESQKRYKSFLSELKVAGKSLTESIENKLSASIQPSSKQKLDEVVEKTAYADDSHIQRMRKMIEYVEKRGKKSIS